MSRHDNWVPLDKSLSQEFTQINRPFSKIEAMFSLSLDIDNDRDWSLKGYAKLWQWSRNKVRKFIEETRTQQGQTRDTLGTQYGHPIHFIDKGLWTEKDRPGTQRGHNEDTPRTPTSNPNNNPNKKEKTFSAKNMRPEFITEYQWEVLLDSRKRKKCQNTEAALKPFVNEFSKAKDLGFDIQACIDEYISGSWTRFKAEWMANKNGSPRQVDPVADRIAELKKARPTTYKQQHDALMEKIAGELNAEDPRLRSLGLGNSNETDNAPLLPLSRIHD